LFTLIRPSAIATLFPYTTLFRSADGGNGPATAGQALNSQYAGTRERIQGYLEGISEAGIDPATVPIYETLNDVGTTHAALEHFLDRKSTRLNSSHVKISYAVFCL